MLKVNQAFDLGPRRLPASWAVAIERISNSSWGLYLGVGKGPARTHIIRVKAEPDAACETMAKESLEKGKRKLSAC